MFSFLEMIGVVLADIENKILGGIKVKVAEGDLIERASLNIGGIEYRGYLNNSATGYDLNFFTPPQRFPHDPLWMPFNLVKYWDIKLELRGNFTQVPQITPQYHELNCVIMEEMRIPIHCCISYAHRIGIDLAEEGYNNIMAFSNGICGVLYAS